MYPQGFVCKRCGHCCLNLDGYATTCSEEDFGRWVATGRADILAWVSTVELPGGARIREIWIDPERFDHALRCPWLRRLTGENRYECRIEDVKPGVCRDYPYTAAHALRTGCRGFNHHPPARYTGLILSQSEPGGLPGFFWSMLADAATTPV
jgi:Fe-S-cluster containining protein